MTRQRTEAANPQLLSPQVQKPQFPLDGSFLSPCFCTCFTLLFSPFLILPSLSVSLLSSYPSYCLPRHLGLWVPGWLWPSVEIPAGDWRKAGRTEPKATVLAPLSACDSDPGQLSAPFSALQFRFWKQLSLLERQPAVPCKRSVKCFSDPASKHNSAFFFLQDSDWKPGCGSVQSM